MPNPSELNERPILKHPQVNPQQQEPTTNHDGGHHNPRQHTMESVQGQQGMTAEQLRRQIEQSVEAKLENKGVYQTAENMNKMVTRPNHEFAQQQQLASAAIAAAVKAHTNDEIMRNDTSKAYTRAVGASKTLGDEVYIRPVPKKAVEFGMENGNTANPTGKKTLSTQPRAEKPVSHNILHSSAEHKVVQEEASDVVQLGTAAITAPSEPDTDNNAEHTGSEQPISDVQSPSAGKINVFFVPNLGDESEISNDDVKLSHIAVDGKSKQIVSSKFRPVVYLKTEEATGYETIDIPCVKVKDGYSQVDAFDYARKNGVELKDIAQNDSFQKMSHHAFETVKPECRIAGRKYSSGTEINPFAVSEKNTILNVPVITTGNEMFNAYEYELAANTAGAVSPSVDDVLNKAYELSLNEDRDKNPDIYRDSDAFQKRCADKANVLRDKGINKEARDKKLQEIDDAFVDAQRQYYVDKGLDNTNIEHLEKLGYIGVESVRFRTHISVSSDLANSMKDISGEKHQILDGAGKFTISSDSTGTNFGGYITQHKDDILGYIGDKLGISDEEGRKHRLHISTPSISDGVSTCVVMYSGFEGKDVDTTVRDVINDVLKEYGDNHARMGNKTYAVEQNEIDYCNFMYSKSTAQYAVPPYGTTAERSVSQQPQTTLNSELDAGFDAAQQAYYDSLAQENAGIDM